MEYFAIPTTPEDAAVMGMTLTDDSRCQQAFESLAVLIALRQWKHHWGTRRVTLGVSSDNMAALSMVCKMQPHGPTLGTIAREMALDIAALSYAPDVVEHIPGITNQAADALSRIQDPSGSVLPGYLNDVPVHRCQLRKLSWWRARPAIS